MITRNRKAFTLLELIVAIVIVAVLALLATTTLGEVKQRAQEEVELQEVAAVMREANSLAALDNSAAPSMDDVAQALADRDPALTVAAADAPSSTDATFRFMATDDGAEVFGESTSRPGACIVGVSAGTRATSRFDAPSDDGCGVVSGEPAVDDADADDTSRFTVARFASSPSIVSSIYVLAGEPSGSDGFNPLTCGTPNVVCDGITRTGDTFSLTVSDPAWLNDMFGSPVQVDCRTAVEVPLDEWLAANPHVQANYESLVAWMPGLSFEDYLSMMHGVPVGASTVKQTTTLPPTSLLISDVLLGPAASVSISGPDTVSITAAPYPAGAALTGLSFTLSWTCPSEVTG